MVRVAGVYVTKDPDAVRVIMAAEDCRMFETFSGQITDRTPGGLCVLGSGPEPVSLVPHRGSCASRPLRQARPTAGTLKPAGPPLLVPTHPG
jgi:hypothetical protein